MGEVCLWLTLDVCVPRDPTVCGQGDPGPQSERPPGTQAKVSGCHGLEAELTVIRAQWVGLALAHPTP